ncbi:MAG TPA: serine hydrolase domain-containing protein [Candidatus Binataceae bacterium]|nr:serine hydrolase domain-containing protein [Candidatus Binataceae bacterium]
MPSKRIITGEAGQASGQLLLVPWWSFTKTVLAGAVLALAARRRLDLDEPIKGMQYSLRNLLQHTSGLPDYGGMADYQAAVAAGEKPWSRDKLLERMKLDKLLFEPGCSWSYSNIGYLIVRQIIERTTGLGLDESIRGLLFDPLGIEGAFVAASIGDLERTVWGNERRYDPGWVYHGLVVGSPSAAASFLHGLLFGALLPAYLKTEMLNPVSAGGPFPGRPFVAPSYGLGVMMDPKNQLGLVVGHTGQGPGSTAAVYSFPGFEEPRTLAAFIDNDDAEASGALEMHLQNLVSSDGTRGPSD